MCILAEFYVQGKRDYEFSCKLFDFGKLPKLTMPEININFTESLKNLFENADYLIYFLVPVAMIWMYIIMDKVLRRYFRTS